MNQPKLSLRVLGSGALAMALWCLSGVADDKPDSVAQSVVAAHNAERQREHKSAMKLSSKLCQAAEVHARDMAKHHKITHEGSDGSTVVDRVKRVGYVYVRVGENVADGQKTVDQVMSAWMTSPGHRANVLGDFTELGVARVDDDRGVNYWCVDFGLPMPQLKPDAAAAEVLKQINTEREAAGMARVKPELRLGRAAMAISAAMAAKDSLDIDDPFRLIDQDALEGQTVRLQMSANTPSPKDASKELQGDHPDQLDQFREIGIGYAQAKSGTPYWCAIFAKRATRNRPPRPR